MTIATPQPAEVQLNSTHFELLPGKLLDIQINYPVKTRLKLPLVGYETGRTIFLKYPSVSSLGCYKDVLVEGNMVIVRYLIEGECCAFGTSVRYVIQNPEKYLVLNYPKKIEYRQLRLHQRVATHLPASVVLKGAENAGINDKITGIIEDISVKGCGFAFKSDNPNLKVNQTEVDVYVRSFTGGEILIPAKVCNCRNEYGKVSIGIQFTGDIKQIKELLESLFIDVEGINHA